MSETDQRADQIRARLAAATPGPWKLNGFWDVRDYVEDNINKIARTLISHDADLIANAPADLTWLLIERDELLRRIEQANEELGRLKSGGE